MRDSGLCLEDILLHSAPKSAVLSEKAPHANAAASVRNGECHLPFSLSPQRAHPAYIRRKIRFPFVKRRFSAAAALLLLLYLIPSLDATDLREKSNIYSFLFSSICTILVAKKTPLYYNRNSFYKSFSAENVSVSRYASAVSRFNGSSRRKRIEKHERQYIIEWLFPGRQSV